MATKAKKDGSGELLSLLRAHPEILNALVFDPDQVKTLLKSKAARKLVGGADTERFLKRLIEPGTGRAIALCINHTITACPRTSQWAAMCVGTSRIPRRREKKD